MWKDIILADFDARRPISHDVLDDSGKDHSSILATSRVDGPLKEHVVSSESSLVPVDVQKDTPKTVLPVKRVEVVVTSEGVEDNDQLRQRLLEHTKVCHHKIELAQKVSILGLSHSVVGVATELFHECTHSFDILN